MLVLLASLNRFIPQSEEARDDKICSKSPTMVPKQEIPTLDTFALLLSNKKTFFVILDQWKQRMLKENYYIDLNCLIKAKPLRQVIRAQN